MKTQTLFAIAASAWLATTLAPTARATTNYVTPGDSIQAAVNAASPGDTIIIFGGTYAESVTVPKQLSILRLAGETVFITGNVTLTAITAAAATPMILSNLKIGGDTTKKLSVNNCTNVVVDNVDLTAGGFTASGSLNVLVGNSPIANADMSSSTVTFQRATVNDFVRMDNTSDTNRALNVLQCTIPNNFVQVSGGLGRILYSNLRMVNLIAANSVVTGNKFASPQGGLDPGVVRLENGAAVVRNNEIGNIAGWGGYGGYGNYNNGVWVSNCALLLANNYIHDLGGVHYEDVSDRNGVYVQSSTKKVEIVGNIFWGTGRPVVAPYDNVTYRYNDDVEGLNRHAGGVIAEAIIAQDPLFVNKTNANYQLSAGSPCINAGPPEVWFNDRDATRNDMGLFGGAAYDPDGQTTDRPITFLLQASPLTLIKGVHTNLTISGGGIIIGK